MSSPASRISLIPSLLRVAWIALRVERSRYRLGPKPSVQLWRQRGFKCKSLSEAQSDRLHRAIRWADERFPGGPNCMRRVLLSIALDPAAAAQPVWIGLNRDVEDAAGKMIVGHAWVGEDKGEVKDYAVELKL